MTVSGVYRVGAWTAAQVVPWHDWLTVRGAVRGWRGS